MAEPTKCPECNSIDIIHVGQSQIGEVENKNIIAIIVGVNSPL